MISTEDLIRDLGVSRTTLSQIINGKGRYAPATRERVLARVRESGYSPHAGARAARLQRFETLVLFNVASFWEGLPHPGIYEGCMEGSATADYRLLLETVSSAGLPSLRRRSNLLGQRNCDGLLMNYHMPPPPDLRRLVTACGIPVMWLNVRLERDCIHPDDQAAAAHLVRALIARGRRRIAYVDFSHDYSSDRGIHSAHFSVGSRIEGARSAAAEAGLDLQTVTPGVADFQQRLAVARHVLSAAGRPDAFICYHTLDSQVLLLAAAEAGLTPGREIGLVQFHERPDALGRPLATALIPFRALGVAASTAVIDAVRSGQRQLPVRSIPFTYHLEGTL